MDLCLSPSGPISGALAHTFGCRAVTIAGSLLATLAYVISVYSSNLNMLILTYGAMGGELLVDAYDTFDVTVS